MLEVGVLHGAARHVVVEAGEHPPGFVLVNGALDAKGVLAEQDRRLAPHLIGSARRGDSHELGEIERGLVVALDRDVGAVVEAASDRRGFAVEAQRPAGRARGQLQMRRRVGEALADRERLAAQRRLPRRRQFTPEALRLLEPAVGEELHVVRQRDQVHACLGGAISHLFPPTDLALFTGSKIKAFSPSIVLAAVETPASRQEPAV